MTEQEMADAVQRTLGDDQVCEWCGRLVPACQLTRQYGNFGQNWCLDADECSALRREQRAREKGPGKARA